MAHVALTDDEDAYKAGLLRKLPGVFVDPSVRFQVVMEWEKTYRVGRPDIIRYQSVEKMGKEHKAT